MVRATLRLGALALTAIQQAGGQQAGRPQDAIGAVTSALATHRLVAIGEMHRNQQVHDFIVSLVRDPRFLPKGGDVVVEFGSARYQDVMDRYVSGDSVDSKTLSKVWRETVNILVWDAPVYERFFAVVRDVNRTRSPANRLRVIVADPAFDWRAVDSRAKWERIAASRDPTFADRIERDVLAPRHQALLIFGSGHVQHETAFGRYDKHGNPVAPNLAELLDRKHPGATFYITADWMNAQTDALLAGTRFPAVLPLEGTRLGAIGIGLPKPTLGELADAFLYLGPESSLTTSKPDPLVYSDTVYLRELLRRDGIQGGANAKELDRLSKRFLKRR